MTLALVELSEIWRLVLHYQLENVQEVLLFDRLRSLKLVVLCQVVFIGLFLELQVTVQEKCLQLLDLNGV